MVEPGSKLARLVNWVRNRMDRKGGFLKSALYSFARDNDLERSALAFVSRCRQNGTMRDRNDDTIEVLIPKDKSLEAFYTSLLRIKDKPIPKSTPASKTEPEKKKELHRENVTVHHEGDNAAESRWGRHGGSAGQQPSYRRTAQSTPAGTEVAVLHTVTTVKKPLGSSTTPLPLQIPRAHPTQAGQPGERIQSGARRELNREKQPQQEEESEKPVLKEEPLRRTSDLANAVAERLEDQFKRIDDKVASVSSFVEHRISNLEKNIRLVTVEELEAKVQQLEKQLEEFREKAETFDLIKRDVWEVIQALDIVEVERDDVKKVLKKFL